MKLLLKIIGFFLQANVCMLFGIVLFLFRIYWAFRRDVGCIYFLDFRNKPRFCKAQCQDLHLGQNNPMQCSWLREE